MRTFKILLNKVQCKSCGIVLESVQKDKKISCACGKITADGGKSFIKRIGSYADMNELSVVQVDGVEIKFTEYQDKDDD